MLDDDGTQRAMAALLAAHRQPGEREVFVRQRGSLAARLAAIDGRWQCAADSFAEALHDETALDHYGQAGELRARWAHALLQLHRLDDAARALQPALARASASGEIAPLRFAGPRALHALAGAAWGSRLDALHRVLLPRAAGAMEPGGTAGAGGAGGSAAAPSEHGLTQREREVLQQIAAGASNKLIARAFDLSPHTVKRHVANILDKLDVSTRGQAAARWRAVSSAR
jgi:LuxR family maltose regulon positive regulatory protein